REAERASVVLLLSSAIVRSELITQGVLDPQRSCIVGSRTIDPDRLDAIVELAPGTRALFVNDRAETAEDCINSLRSLGLVDIDLQPWYPGQPAPEAACRIALVAGESSLVPPGIAKVIDIGVRIFDMGTLAELSAVLGLPARDLGRFSQRYLSKIVSLAQRLARSDELSRQNARHLASVIDSLRHGILVYDEKERVSVCNEEARTLLTIRQGRILGSPISSLLKNPELLAFLRRRGVEEETILPSAIGNIAIKRFELGDGRHCVATIRSVEDSQPEEMRLGREYLRRGHIAKYTFNDIKGESEVIRRAVRIAERLAATDISILIYGESGTGKELFSSAMHAASERRHGPFLAVDLGSLSDDLIESELFGYEEGAFTGAKKGGKAGLFELADGGTIFLDEIANISPKVQQRLLRVLQEKEIMRVGSAEIRHVDVRVIAATNEDLYARAARGQFREDLYFRLKMGFLRIPPLRERRSDIPLLIRWFLQVDGCCDIEVDENLMRALIDRPWHGNVRELRNTITYLLAVRNGTRLSLEELPDPEYFEAVSEISRREKVQGVMPQTPLAGVPHELSGGVVSSSLPHPSEELQAAGNLDSIDRMILQAIAERRARGMSAGRESIAAWLASKGIVTGTGVVRGRCERLESLGLVFIRRGRLGAELSPSARAILG
ncbi:MAG: sigma 54-interacting transcriptional regulator, partial [Spirochaetales bacterium]|nr:sigma 54-interacting transcriptional regulator [Spirochaetales bacterium]